ncbi:MAG: O-antigen ligase family protein [Clostridium sp.]|uniref:O-antigen ligase family protein n=1 Tax=Clostridium sp. TaxID=1506 RepID=UPI00302E6AB3
MTVKLNKTKIFYLGLFFLLEALFISVLWNSEAKLTLLLGVLGIPCILGIVNFMFKSLERALMAIGFLVPMLPISGYVMLRLNLLEIQWVVYVGFYIIAAIALLKNGIINSVKWENVIIKNKVIRVILMLLLVISCIFAFDKGISFMIISLSFIPFGLFILTLKAVEVEDKKGLLNNVLLAVCIGCIVSSIPDILYFFMTWAGGNKNIRIFGPIGSNFILIYDLLILAILLAKWGNQKTLKTIWTPLVISMCFIISMQLSRGAWVSFFLIMFTFIVFNLKNWKRYVVLTLIFGSMLTYNVMDRADVKEDTNVKEIQDIIISGKPPEVNLGESGPGHIIMKMIESQSKTRQVLWKAGIGVSMDYPYSGVGIGNFKYFFQEYSGSERAYSDAHNIILNMSSELGIPFMVVSMILLITIGIGALVNYFKFKNRSIKLNNVAIMAMVAVFFVYGNLTGISFQTTNEIYSFTPTFIILFVLFYRDYVEVL